MSIRATAEALGWVFEDEVGEEGQPPEEQIFGASNGVILTIEGEGSSFAYGHSIGNHGRELVTNSLVSPDKALSDLYDFGEPIFLG